MHPPTDLDEASFCQTGNKKNDQDMRTPASTWANNEIIAINLYVNDSEDNYFDRLF